MCLQDLAATMWLALAAGSFTHGEKLILALGA
jgi:hypothetical protein